MDHRAPNDQSVSAPPGWLLFLALTFTGAGQALISPPLNWWWLLSVLWLPGLWALSHLSGLYAFVGGWWLGTSSLLAIFYWVVHTVKTFSNLPTSVAVVVLIAFSLFWGFYAAIFAWGLRSIRRVTAEHWPWAVAAWFVACEYLNPQLFPFYQGVVLYQQTSIFLVTALLGVPFLSFMALSANGLLLQALERRRAALPIFAGPIKRSALIWLGLVLFSVGYSQYRDAQITEAEAQAESSRLAMVQTNRGVQELRKLRKKGPMAQVDDFAGLSRKALSQDESIDVVVWAEGALRGHARHPSSRSARRLVRDFGVELWTGGGSWKKLDDGRRVFHNSAFRLHRGDDGRVLDDERYDKRILLPFGEFMPLDWLLPVLRKIQGVGNYQPGEGILVLDTPHGHISFLICYEAIRHRYVREAVQQGADILVNITYDAWFGDTSNPTQHLMLSALQSAQYGVPLVRSATTGISAVTDARGRLVETGPLFERMVLTADVPRVNVSSPYRWTGDLFAWLCIAFSALGIWRGRVAGRRWDRRRSLVLAMMTIGTACIPLLSWLANPHILLGDWLAWGLALTTLTVLWVEQARLRLRLTGEEIS